MKLSKALFIFIFIFNQSIMGMNQMPSQDQLTFKLCCLRFSEVCLPWVTICLLMSTMKHRINIEKTQAYEQGKIDALNEYNLGIYNGLEYCNAKPTLIPESLYLEGKQAGLSHCKKNYMLRDDTIEKLQKKFSEHTTTHNATLAPATNSSKKIKIKKTVIPLPLILSKFRVSCVAEHRSVLRQRLRRTGIRACPP